MMEEIFNDKKRFLKNTLGFGAAIWAIMFVVVSVFIAFTIYEFIWMQAVTALISAGVAYTFAGKVKPGKLQIAIIYGASWVVTGLFLDLVITTFFNDRIFSSWSLWVGYLFILLSPFLWLKLSLRDRTKDFKNPTI